MPSPKSLKPPVGHIGHHGMSDCCCVSVDVENDYNGSDGCHKMRADV